MKFRNLVLATAGLGLGAISGVAVSTQASALPLCGGNQTVQQAPVDCTNSKLFTFGTLQRTMTIVLHVPASGSPSTVTWTLDKTVPQSFQVRVVAHENTSGAGGAVDSDVTSTFPANSLGPVVTTFTVGCGQIDIKAVFIDNAQSQGRVGGPYVCATSVAPTTTVAPTTVPTTPLPVVTTSAPGTTGGTPPVSSVVPTSAGVAVAVTLPPTGAHDTDARLWVVFGLVSIGAILIIVTALVRRVPAR